MPSTPTADEYRAGLLLLQQQQRAKLTALIEQVDGALARDWQRSMGYAAALYRPVIDAYARELAALRREVDDPSAKLTLDWLTSRNSQLATIERSVRASLDTYGQQSAATVTAAQAASAERGAADAAQLTQRSLWPAVEGAGVPPAMLFNRPNPDAIAQWVGRAGNGHPLGDLFSNFGAEATQLARKEMLLGLATGANPKAMAAGIANALGVSRSRAIIISRTEVLGSYRSAAHETYRANADVINGWLWSAGGNNPCFPAGTLITTKRGMVPIEAVRIGDEVLTHELRFQPVTGWATRLYTGEMVDMCAAGQQVTATTEHPFLVQQRYGLGWLAAGRLRRGDYVVRDGSDSVVVDAIVHYDMDALSVYNLSVAADESYIANGFIVHNCAMCMGMDGLQFSLEEELVDHPCGRCSPVPITKSWDDILGPWGIDSEDMLETSMGAPGAYETGEERFARMSAQQQRVIIGTKTGYDAYKRGEVTLKDFVGRRPAENGWPAMPYQKSLKEMEIPTGRAGSNLVERAPRLTELEREGNLRYRDFGAPIPPDEMPKWAQQSPATEAVYQILRNGLPWSMRDQEGQLLAMNLEQMLKEELPLNVRLAALRQQDVLQQYEQYLNRYVRNVTGGASTLGKAPEFVYTPSRQLERALAAARAGERGAFERTVAQEVAQRATGRSLSEAETRQLIDMIGMPGDRARIAEAAYSRIADKLADNPAWANYLATSGKAPEQAIEDLATIFRGTILEGEGNAANVGAMMRAVRDELGLTDARAGFAESLTDAEAIYARDGAALRAYVRAAYEDTQQYFRDQGISEITLFRGGSVGDKPFNSFSVDRERAAIYGTSVREVSVPVEQILGLPQSGIGNAVEGEVIVLSHSPAELERALAAARASERTALEAGQQAAVVEQTTEIAPKVASQEALDALAQAQAQVDELRALYEKAQSEGMRFYMPDGTDETILRLAQAQARVDAEMGGRGAVIHYSSAGNPFTAQQEVDSFTVRAFGRALTRDELGSLVGAPEGSYVDIAGFEDSIGIQMHGPGWNPLIATSESEYRADRTLSMGRNGLLRMENEHFHVRSDLRDQGIGARIFADQVMSLSHFGVDRIETFGAGFGERVLGTKAVDVNGYYTWARFGYVGKISDGAKQVIREAIEHGEIPATYGNFTTVQQFMRTEEGRAVWQAYGQGLDLRFDLKPDSLSMRTLRAYLAAKGLL